MDSVESDAGQQMLYQIEGFKTIILFRMIFKPAEYCKRKKTTPSPTQDKTVVDIIQEQDDMKAHVYRFTLWPRV
jgi:hypothetical protein